MNVRGLKAKIRDFELLMYEGKRSKVGNPAWLIDYKLESIIEERKKKFITIRKWFKMNVLEKMDFHNYSSHFGDCRFCSTPGRHRVLTNEYSINGERLIFRDIFSKCFNVSLSTNPNLSSLICANCVRKLEEAHNFKSSVLDNERKLLARIGSISQQTEFVNVTNGQQNDDNEFVYEDIKQEFITEDDDCHQHDDSDDRNDDDDDCGKYEIEIDQKPLLSAITATENKPELVQGEAELVSRFGRNPLPLPTRDSLFTICPMYFGHLTAMEGRTIEIRDIADLLEDNPIDTQKKTQKPRRINSRPDFARDVATIFENSNATAFKGKMRSGFPCFYCRNIFCNPEALREHQLTHPKSTLLPILKKFSSDTLIVYADVTDLKCTICDENISNLAELKSHLMETHRKKFVNEFADRVIPFKLENKESNYECQICETWFETFGAIDRHMNVHCRNFVCEKCGSGFVTKHRLKVHVYIRHPLRNGGKTCEVCNKVFATLHQYKIHNDIVHKKLKKMKCIVCGEGFIDYFTRQRHLEEKHGFEKILYKCTMCDKQYNRKFSLTTHIKRCHDMVKNYQCELCPYMSFSRTELEDHKLKHTGEKNFECLICNKLFMRKKALNLHAKVHNNDRKYFCHLCGESFLQNSNLKSHLNTHNTMLDP